MFFGPPDVSPVVLPVPMELPCAPPVADDDHHAATGAGIRKCM